MRWMTRAKKWMTRAKIFTFALVLALFCAAITATLHWYGFAALFSFIVIVLCIPIGIAISASVKILNKHSTTVSESVNSADDDTLDNADE